MQIRLRNYIAKKFNEQKLIDINAFDDFVILSKLFAEAKTLMEDLDVNDSSECYVSFFIDNMYKYLFMLQNLFYTIFRYII